MIEEVEGGESVPDKARVFLEKIAFADADSIVMALYAALHDDWMAMPVWARNLAFRLACLQRPDDAMLLREAAADLSCFGEWEEIARAMSERSESSSNLRGILRIKSL
ncbi:hypothetical protein GXW82_10815 [Streptacidiphilus sp. 4-A2]|nr:hypothetical protein [Streptacidiphilus sp. 4-A2]